MLYIVPTPIGNLADMTFRAIEVLKEVTLILAEDTRTSGKLLKHYAIDTPTRPFHQHNEHKVFKEIVARLAAGEDMALISDAGTPGISDPGFLLVRECVEQGVTIYTLPGATAFVPALVNSGLPTDRFVYEGFLPHKKGRATRLQAIVEEQRTVVLYESPHRVSKLLKEIYALVGDERQVSVSRELSKIHEETLRGTASQLIEHFETAPPRGEFVVCIAGAEKKKAHKK